MSCRCRNAVAALAVLSLVAVSFCAQTCRADPTPQAPVAASPTGLTFPYAQGQLKFPDDEGKHAFNKWPMTLVEWYAFYSHLTADDGTRYMVFATIVTFDPVSKMLQDKFPHFICTVVDTTHGKTYNYREMAPLKQFAAGNANAETAGGSYFRQQAGKPYCYDLHYAAKSDQIDFAMTTELKAEKLPLVLQGTGYIKVPKGDSGYYSQTRCAQTGTITIGGVTKKVTGIHWTDRQWMGVTCATNHGYTYEWWSLQMDNGDDAILFRIFENKTNAVAMTHLENLHKNGAREECPDVKLTDAPGGGWDVSSASAKWDLKVRAAGAGMTTWQDCDVTGTIGGQSAKGICAAELARDVMREYAKAIKGDAATE